jgi:hypothetical protein
MTEVVACAGPSPVVRVAAWLRGERPTLSYRPLSISEPVVYRGGRAHPSPVDARRLDALVHVARVRTTDPRQVIGAKPAAFCWWVFDLLSALPGDEPRPLCRLVGDRQALWGMTDEETAARLGPTEARWIGKATARRILLGLSGPRRPCTHESEWAGRARARDERARGRARDAERRAS